MNKGLKPLASYWFQTHQRSAGSLMNKGLKLSSLRFCGRDSTVQPAP